LFLWAPSLSAQDATSFLREVSLHYLSLSAYQAQAGIILEEIRPNYHSRRSADITVYWTPARSNQVQLFLTTPISPGSHLLAYDRILRPQQFHQGESQHTPLIRLSPARFAGEETLTVPCRIVEIDYLLPDQKLTLKLWIDPARRTVWKEEATWSHNKRTVLFREVHLDRSIDPANFTRNTNPPRPTPPQPPSDTPPSSDATTIEATAALTRAATLYRGLQRIRIEATQIVTLPGVGDDFIRNTTSTFINVTRPDTPMLHQDIVANLITARMLATEETEFASRKVSAQKIEAWYSKPPTLLNSQGLPPYPPVKAHRVVYWLHPETGLVLKWRHRSQYRENALHYHRIDLNQDTKLP